MAVRGAGIAGAPPLVQHAFTGHDIVRHIKIQDGSGRPLGRSFNVKLWPTLIFLKNGREIGRLVRPTDGRDIESVMSAIDPDGVRTPQ